MFRRALIMVALAGVAAVPVSAQTLDEILAKNLQARGGLEKLKSVQTIRMTGTVTVGPGMEAPFVLEQKRPDLMRLDFTLQGMTGTQAYDGKVGWQVMPFNGRKDPEPIAEDELKQLKEQADFDGPLVDYKAKGNQVELLGKEKVEGTDAWKIKVTLKSGDTRYFYLDADQYLEIRMEGKTTIRGTEVEGEATMGDWKDVDGLMLPFAVESGVKGSPQRMKMTFKEAVLNPPIDDARFKMPATEVKK